MNTKMVKVGDLKPAAYNPRIISDDTLTKLEKGIAEFGMVEPLVVNEDMTVVGGHQRLKAAINLGIAEVPCVFVKLDKTKEKALNLALNRLHGEWDHGQLAVMLKELEADTSLDIELTGFDNVELAGLVDFSSFDVDKMLSGTEMGAEAGHAPPSPVISYTIIFSDEAELAAFGAWIRGLKNKYPHIDTIGGRIIEEIGG